MVQQYSNKVKGVAVVCTCKATASKLFTAAGTELSTHMFGFLLIPIDVEMALCLIIPGVAAVIFAMYLGLLLMAYFIDRRDRSRV